MMPIYDTGGGETVAEDEPECGDCPMHATHHGGRHVTLFLFGEEVDIECPDPAAAFGVARRWNRHFLAAWDGVKKTNALIVGAIFHKLRQRGAQEVDLIAILSELKEEIERRG